MKCVTGEQLPKPHICLANRPDEGSRRLFTDQMLTRLRKMVCQLWSGQFYTRKSQTLDKHGPSSSTMDPLPSWRVWALNHTLVLDRLHSAPRLEHPSSKQLSNRAPLRNPTSGQSENPPMGARGTNPPPKHGNNPMSTTTIPAKQRLGKQ